MPPALLGSRWGHRVLLPRLEERPYRVPAPRRSVERRSEGLLVDCGVGGADRQQGGVYRAAAEGVEGAGEAAGLFSLEVLFVEPVEGVCLCYWRPFRVCEWVLCEQNNLSSTNSFGYIFLCWI